MYEPIRLASVKLGRGLRLSSSPNRFTWSGTFDANHFESGGYGGTWYFAFQVPIERFQYVGRKWHFWRSFLRKEQVSSPGRGSSIRSGTFCCKAFRVKSLKRIGGRRLHVPAWQLGTCGLSVSRGGLYHGSFAFFVFRRLRSGYCDRADSVQGEGH